MAAKNLKTFLSDTGWTGRRTRRKKIRKKLMNNDFSSIIILYYVNALKVKNKSFKKSSTYLHWKFWLAKLFGLFVLDYQIFNKDHICQMYSIDLFRFSIVNLSLPLQPSERFALLDKPWSLPNRTSFTNLVRLTG